MQEEILLGLIGHPVSHSISPAIHIALLASKNLKGDYRLHDVETEALAQRIAELRRAGYTGLNVTIPHKIEVMKYLDDIDEKARAVGAINTIHFNKDRLSGYNTDVDGFKDALLSRKRSVGSCLIYGLGGAARACLMALASLDNAPECVYLCGRDAQKARQLATELRSKEPFKSFGITALDLNKDRLSEFKNLDLFVNASPVGQGINADDRYRSLIKEFRDAEGDLDNKLVFDLVYSREKEVDTESVALAKELGLSSIDGYAMLIRQAIKSFQIWTGKSVPVKHLQIL